MYNSFELNESVRRALDRYSQSLIKIAFAYLKNMADAEEVAQDVFLAYLQKRPVFENNEHEKAWLIRTTINKSKNMLKAGWFRSRNPVPENLSYLPREENEVLQAVLALDKKYRIPIHLHYYEGYSIQEIADILQAKPATVGTWLARGRMLLKEKIGGAEDEAFSI
ncbi:RNA polymerase sigma-70 factor, ECF subfamily [Cohnella sp. OV330]|uniref:Sigma-70 family RNA polymerase sigma factor n=2 Tax=Cohnella TaxID=329857 RepID=A0A9X4QUF9_9BACL|nr:MULTISPECIES: sigma-70 family RNA polymerase sigma factor [Cohnella]MDG0811378.1 sigma-70 family RNA polymerase sigma factor [Cohnella rhizosphaerae]MDI4649800.1 sigma-70 family RNA polymerase sigma factor [Cohnella hashimotonis]SFB51578.1 RNA polymerase sigma-70 factor, ECF subfamily [Cohnella sp. OV330]